MESPDSKENDSRSKPVPPEANEDDDEPKVQSDRWNYVLLIFLYIFQGIFGGMLHAVPLVMQENGVSYGEQALLKVASLSGWLKLLWAPLVECIYFSRMGKRKSWLIPTQYLLGLMMLTTSFEIDSWLGGGNKKPNVLAICLILFFAEFFLTTMDMVVDSWALTMLRRENVGYQATCNLIGFRIGSFLGYALFMILRSEEISGYLGQKASILTFSGYLFFWSVLLLICNTGVLIVKKDTTLQTAGYSGHMTICQSYRLIWDILKMKSVQKLCIILLFCKAGVGPIIGLTSLKFIRGGLKPATLVLLSIPLIPLQSTLPFILRRYFEGSQGLTRFAQGIMFMIPVGVLFSFLLWNMPNMKNGEGQLTNTFYILYFVFNGLEYMVMFLTQASFMSFLAKITDPKFGAVYLTVVQTIRSAGFLWPMYLSLTTVDMLTVYKHNCSIKNDPQGCVLLDGYYVEILIGSVFSICFLRFGGLNAMRRIQNLNESEWRVPLRGRGDAEQANEAETTV